MHRCLPLIALALLLRLMSQSTAALIVEDPRPITHQVTVQLIQTALDDGSSPATVFGDASRRAAIEFEVDRVWAQAGIDIRFLPNIVRYNDTFAYQGNSLLGTRPLTDLEPIMVGAQLHGGILHPDPSVINLFLVHIAPGYPLNPENWVNGAGNLGANGIAMFIGSGTSSDHAAHWASHEIAHNLGLLHTGPGIENLMASKRINSRLTDEQITAVFQTQGRSDGVALIPPGGTGFPQLLPTVPGDYDRNGNVDALDYVLWRKAMNSGVPLIDGNGDGRTDAQDYMVWKSNFGDSSVGASAASAAALIAAELFADAGVPEPASTVLLVSALAVIGLGAQCRASRKTY
jgi:hypothetical protein